MDMDTDWSLIDFNRKILQKQSIKPPAHYPPRPERARGQCRYCGDHIGRGVAFHEKRCKQVTSDDDANRAKG